MTDEAKALVGRLRQLAGNTGKMTWVNDKPMTASDALNTSADLIETQAREIERLRGHCDKADSLADHWFVEYETLRDGLIDILARAALAGDSHDQ